MITLVRSPRVMIRSCLSCDDECAENDGDDEKINCIDYENQVPLVLLAVLGGTHHPDHCYCHHRVHAKGIA